LNHYASVDEQHEALWTTSTSFLGALIRQMIFASVDLPEGYDHMSINFKDGFIFGNVFVY
jgi:hypothetical protein